jgi:hypothetical protein
LILDGRQKRRSRVVWHSVGMTVSLKSPAQRVPFRNSFERKLSVGSHLSGVVGAIIVRRGTSTVWGASAGLHPAGFRHIALKQPHLLSDAHLEADKMITPRGFIPVPMIDLGPRAACRSDDRSSFSNR